MKNLIYILLLVYLSLVANSQVNTQGNFPWEKELITIKGDTIRVDDIFKDTNPKLLFFWFTGCTGCKISLDQTLIKHYKEWKDKFGVQIIAISGDKEANRKMAVEFFRKYPFDLYFDIERELFVFMPETPWKGKTIKAYPTLMFINSDKKFQAIDAWDANKIKAELEK